MTVVGAAFALLFVAAGVADAKVGVISVAQLSATGQIVCSHDFPVGNLFAPQLIHDPACPGAAGVLVRNNALSGLTITSGPFVATGSGFGTLAIPIVGGLDIHVGPGI